ncbi:MAG: peptidoglycan DD-metalloendopeptidase family protein [Kosmotogaceae bacterium]
MSAVNSKLDDISSQNEDVEEMKTEIGYLSNDLNEIDKHLKTIEDLIDDSSDNEKIEEILNEMEEIKRKLNEIEVVGANNEKTVGEIGEKIDKYIKTVEEKMIVEKELQNIREMLKVLTEQTPDEDKEKKISLLESRIERLEEAYSDEASSFSFNLFLSEIADIRSKAGSDALYLGDNFVKYTVRSGDSLWGIARAYDIDLEDLRSSNPLLKNSNVIHSGDKLFLPINFEEILHPDIVKEAIGFPNNYEEIKSSIISTYGSYDNGYANPGIDLNLEAPIYIRNILPGRVIEVGELNEFYGLAVLIDHGDGYRTVYSRLSESELEKDDFVKAGDIVGITKNEKVNLHFELWKGEIPINPADILFSNMGEFEITMYTEWDDGKNPTSPSFKMTSSGTYVKQYRTVSADPEVFPAGTIIYVPYFANEQNKGFFVVEDTGNEIKGKSLDIYIRDYEIASSFNKDLLVYKVYTP